jgi:hypothetical protein
VLRTAVPFEGPDACAIIGNGSIVVAEFVGRRVQLLSRSGRLLQVFKGHTSGSNGGNRAALERRALCLTPARVPAIGTGDHGVHFRLGQSASHIFGFGASR